MNQKKFSAVRRLTVLVKGVAIGLGATLLFTLSVSVSEAATAVNFTSNDLAAFSQLSDPSSVLLTMDKTSGVVQPGPVFLFLGIDRANFEAGLSGVGKLANLHYHHLRSESVRLAFIGERIRARVTFADQKKAISSLVGSISFTGAYMDLWLTVGDTASGAPAVTLAQVDFEGAYKGNGALAPKFLVDEVKKIAEKVVRKKIDALLNEPSTLNSIEKVLVTWAKASRSKALEQIVPGTLRISDGTLLYSAE
ncbi:MAG: hypothetical protein H7301_11715 [Cryobacterium sp.]|nr:hypothetical protein [Oligoflexia bacterium]